ncbi:MAG TPA: DNA primase, partial [Chitinophagaceae bacterium]|nr:DNA primase [Chitinophagaceae bacterium]
WLAAKYNVEIEETEVSSEQKQLQQAADSLYIINNFAQKFFTEKLFDTQEGQDVALSYLHERGFREEVIRKFQLGYSPGQRDVFAKAATEAQYNPELLQKSGLVVLRDDRLVDNYRGRIIFPVHNQTGKIIGFGARIIGKNNKAPKYINTPENELYIKSKILYGSYFARQAIDKNDECLLVEGYTDVISLYQAGIENVVASGGTSLTQDQLRLIKKYTSNLTIIYDGDAAGVKAALRGLDMALEEGLNVKLVLIPDNEDPDSYVNKVGVTAFRNFVAANKKDFIIFQLEIALKDAANDTTKKAAVVNQVAETISRINRAEDFTKQQDYIRQSAALLKIEETGLTALVNKFIREKISKIEAKLPVDEAIMLEQQATSAPQYEEGLNLLQRDELQERALVKALLEFGTKEWDEQHTVASLIFREAEEQDLVDNPQLLRVMQTYKKWYDEGLSPTDKTFIYHDDLELSSLVVSIMDFPYELSHNWKEHFDGKIFTRDDLYREEVTSVLTYLKLKKIKHLIAENQKDLERPHTSEEQLILIQTHQHLKQMERELLNGAGTVIIK